MKNRKQIAAYALKKKKKNSTLDSGNKRNEMSAGMRYAAKTKSRNFHGLFIKTAKSVSV